MHTVYAAAAAAATAGHVVCDLLDQQRSMLDARGLFCKFVGVQQFVCYEDEVVHQLLAVLSKGNRDEVISGRSLCLTLQQGCPSVMRHGACPVNCGGLSSQSTAPTQTIPRHMAHSMCSKGDSVTSCILHQGLSVSAYPPPSIVHLSGYLPRRVKNCVNNE